MFSTLLCFSVLSVSEGVEDCLFFHHFINNVLRSPHFYTTNTLIICWVMLYTHIASLAMLLLLERKGLGTLLV